MINETYRILHSLKKSKVLCQVPSSWSQRMPVGPGQQGAFAKTVRSKRSSFLIARPLNWGPWQFCSFCVHMHTVGRSGMGQGNIMVFTWSCTCHESYSRKLRGFIIFGDVVQGIDFKTKFKGLPNSQLFTQTFQCVWHETMYPKISPRTQTSSTSSRSKKKGQRVFFVSQPNCCKSNMRPEGSFLLRKGP